MSILEKDCIHATECRGTLLFNESLAGNPMNDFAARLIESCGLKGHRIGGAMVSSKHANFIINHEGTASAADIEALIHLVQTKVKEQTKIDFVHEVHIIGDK